MLGFLFAAACAVGLVAVLRGGRPFLHRRRRVLHSVLEKIDATPAQEKAIVEIVNGLCERGRALKNQLKESRAEVARVLEGERFDDRALEELNSRYEHNWNELRRDAVAAFANLHDLLDAEQRRTLAKLIERGPSFGHFAPYRHRHGGYGASL